MFIIVTTYKAGGMIYFILFPTYFTVYNPDIAHVGIRNYSMNNNVKN